MSNTTPLPTLDKLSFELSSDGNFYTVRASCVGISGNVVIPAMYEGKPVKEINYLAFQSCEALTSIIIPNSVTSIGSNAFTGCSSLTSISIPDSVTSIGNYAFNWCSALTSITIGSGVTSIGIQIFDSCLSLVYIAIDPNNTVYKSEGNCLIEKSTNKLLYGCNNSVIPDYVTSIESTAFFNYNNLTSISIPDSVITIGGRAFESCDNLKQIEFGNSLSTIKSGAFCKCINLTSISIPNSIENIADSVFNDCKNLTNVILKGKPDNINGYAFSCTPELKKIYTVEGTGWQCGDTIGTGNIPIEILPADGAVVAKTMSVKSMKIS